MNINIINDNWQQIKSKIKQEWEKFIEDVSAMQDDHKELQSKLQEMYHFDKDQASNELDFFLKKHDFYRNSKHELNSVIVKSCEVVGVNVKNQNKESLGKIHEIVLDKFTGYVRYVVLASGGFLGLNDKLYALPWSSISYDPQQKCFIANIELENLNNAASFDKNHWPNLPKNLGNKFINLDAKKPSWI